MKKALKITADKEHLEEVVDRADYAMLYSFMVDSDSEGYKNAKNDYKTACGYFTFLGVKALEDEEFAEELEETIGELVDEKDTSMEGYLIPLHQFVRIGRWIRFDPPDNPGVEELEKDLERFFSAAPLEEIRETMKSVKDYLRSLPKKKRKKLENQMFA